MVLPVSFILGNAESVVAGKCQPSLGNIYRGCVSARAQTCWEAAGISPSVWVENQTHMYVYMYVCMCALPPAGDRRVEGVGFNLCVRGQLC